MRYQKSILLLLVALLCLWQPMLAQEQVADLQKSMDDPSNTIYDADFIGAGYLPGTTTAMKVGGYVNLSLVRV